MGVFRRLNSGAEIKSRGRLIGAEAPEYGNRYHNGKPLTDPLKLQFMALCYEKGAAVGPRFVVLR